MSSVIDDLYPMLGLSAEPSRIYARTLTALLAGDLDEAAASEYLQAHGLIIGGDLRLPVNGFVLHRLHMLGHLIAERFGYYRAEFTGEKRVGLFKKEMEATGLRRAQAAWHPEFPDVLGRFSHAGFELIERCLADTDQSERERWVLACWRWRRSNGFGLGRSPIGCR